MYLLDQRRLPGDEVWETYTDAASVAEAITAMKVRGAPAIAAAAAYGIAVEALRLVKLGFADIVPRLKSAMHVLENARPTAVNLAWAVRRMGMVVEQTTRAAELPTALLEQAERIAREDVATNRRIGENGSRLFNGLVNVLTHCNTGSLATVEYGTALGVIRKLYEDGKLGQVFVDETRPYLQGARLTTYELRAEGIPHTLITDNMAGYFMKQGEVNGVIVGADRIAANGDTANKIGTYGLAVLCQFHGIPFYVAAPLSTFDLSTASGEDIPIEERSEAEVLQVLSQPIAPEGTRAAHPAFDVTPHDLITAIITEHGIIHSPNVQTVSEFMRTVKSGV